MFENVVVILVTHRLKAGFCREKKEDSPSYNGFASCAFHSLVFGIDVTGLNKSGRSERESFSKGAGLFPFSFYEALGLA